LTCKTVYKKSVLRDLSRLNGEDALRILDRIETDLAETADSCPPLTGRFAGLRKYHIEDYRVVFAIIDSEVKVLRIGHRREVYRKEI
jgi:mRNA interferase RelE/StbE